MSEHHPSCRSSDKDLVWLCAQCGIHESAESLLIRGEQLAEAFRQCPMLDDKEPILTEWWDAIAKPALVAWEKEAR